MTQEYKNLNVASLGYGWGLHNRLIDSWFVNVQGQILHACSEQNGE